MHASIRRVIISIIPCDKHYNARMYKVHGENRERKTHSIMIEGIWKRLEWLHTSDT